MALRKYGAIVLLWPLKGKAKSIRIKLVMELPWQNIYVYFIFTFRKQLGTEKSDQESRSYTLSSYVRSIPILK